MDRIETETEQRAAQLLYTKKQLSEVHEKALDMLLEVVGGSKAHLAKMLGVKENTVYSWYKQGRISKRGALMCERHPNIKMNRIVFRPEILDGQWEVDEEQETS